MGEHRHKLSKVDRMVGAAMKKSVLSYGQCTGYVATDFTEFKKMRGELAEQGKKASTSAYFAKAMAIAMKDFPELNGILIGDDELAIYDEVNVGVGVQTEEGIIVVVVKNCDKKSVMEINEELADKVERARTGKLTMDDITGGTITMSNLSMTREDFFTSIIVGDQVLIIGFGGINKRPFVVNDEVVVRDVANIMVNMNHTASRGFPVTMYLCRIAEIVEDPRTYLM